ncbi:MAG: hypothetical protein M3O62_08150 [Pseudomonadota bacterium]|nr:hypothetical protein [Pseudomonadota bacterium]
MHGCNDIRGLLQMRSFMIKLSSHLRDASKLDPVIDAELQAIVSTARVLGVRLSALGVGVESIGSIVA